ncbi:50S ribosomal protein L25/general stress protein Ctc [Chitinimonas sp. BJB300]|uniref:50S ribosomal protein L25/general stress protein Ctc n=1 Tax=Chitinimonas sp. BJB300 TaxID=1559339 RepID=UPI000C0E210E|nr:50S ribosomal protein L25/general stress protein Ctc [Chitinimonas sp. BJB300]PHV12726.1 50S ribosomal protein L25/general stress protein Ctc [Chitinimonas sp. BJB300]TSJ90906.1 50S ribosomal protein L25/general stress protein Ctc [Chitinimonas sp. BJB300]
MTIEVIATGRTQQGTGASRRLRNAGKVPGIVYGADQTPVAIELDHNNLYYAMQNEVFHASVLSLVIDGKAEPVLIRDAQYHPWKQIIMHVDFQRVDANKTIHTKVPFHFINAENAPGVKASGGIVSHVLNEVEVSCLPSKLPEFIEVDLIDLQAGHSIHLADIKLPEGVELVALKHGDNGTVATILAIRGGATEETPAA